MGFYVDYWIAFRLYPLLNYLFNYVCNLYIYGRICLWFASLSWLCFCIRRSNLKGLYRGDIYNVYNCQRRIRASRPALVCWMGFTSFTAAHICIGTAAFNTQENRFPSCWKPYLQYVLDFVYYFYCSFLASEMLLDLGYCASYISYYTSNSRVYALYIRWIKQ